MDNKSKINIKTLILDHLYKIISRDMSSENNSNNYVSENKVLKIMLFSNLEKLKTLERCYFDTKSKKC